MSGGVLLTKVLYYSKDSPTNAVDITDVFSMSINKSIEIKNNIFSLVLKNLPLNYDGTYIRGKYVKSDFRLRFQEEDQLIVYAKLTNDGDDIGSTWYGSDELIGTFIVEEYVMNTVENSARVTLKAVDRAFVYFNKVWTYNYGVGNTFTTPGIFRHMCRYWTDKDSLDNPVSTVYGTNYDSGIKFAVDARFTSEGGLIKDYRTVTEGGPSTQLAGALNDSDTTITVDSTTGFKTAGTIVVSDGTTTEHIVYTGVSATEFTGCTRGIDFTVPVAHSDNTDVYQGFPTTVISKTWKPVFEWFGELIQTEYTNYSDETGIGDSPFYDRAFLFYIDENNNANFLPADQDVDLDLELGSDDFRSFNLTRSVFDSINFVVYNCGTDMYGNGVLWYYYDESSDLSSLKMRYQPFTNVLDELVKKDIEINSTRDTSSTPDVLKQFPASYSPAITSWGFKEEQNSWENLRGETLTTELTSNSDYNDGLRKAAKWVGYNSAVKLTLGLAGLRYKGSLALEGRNIRPGDLVRVTNRYTGINEQLLRVIQVSHNINRNGWETVIECEEDEKVIL